MTAPTYRAAIVQQIPMIASLTGRDVREVWGDCYREFGDLVGVFFVRMAYNEDREAIDIIEREGLLAEFAEFVEKKLKEKAPALPDKEKAPLPGSLIDEKEAAK